MKRTQTTARPNEDAAAAPGPMAARALRRMGIDPTDAGSLLDLATAPWDDDSRPFGVSWAGLDAAAAWALTQPAVRAAAAEAGIDPDAQPAPSAA